MSLTYPLHSPVPAIPMTALPPTGPLYSLVVPVYLKADPSFSLSGLLQGLQSFLSSTDQRTTEILVLDDCSPGANLTEIPLPPGLTVVRQATNLGFANNCNAGAQMAQGKTLVFCNQDILALHTGWVEAMAAVLSTSQVGVVGPRLVFENGAVQSVGGLFDGGKGPYHRYLGWQNALDPRVSQTERVSWTTGACLMIEKNDFLACGGFRGDLYPGGYFEDVHLCLEVQHRLGKETWYCAQATLQHRVGSTGGNPSFMKNSARFHQNWDRVIQPDTGFVYVNF